jgi:hypothetical protein
MDPKHNRDKPKTNQEDRQFAKSNGGHTDQAGQEKTRKTEKPGARNE